MNKFEHYGIGVNSAIHYLKVTFLIVAKGQKYWRHCQKKVIYINNIVNSDPFGDFVLFADDTNIFVEDGQKLSKVRSAKLLVVIIDDQLIWDPHAQHLTE